MAESSCQPRALVAFYWNSTLNRSGTIGMALQQRQRRVLRVFDRVT
jgi:hypothetical protein